MNATGGTSIARFTSGYLSLCIYLHQVENRKYYDVVMYRKIRKDGRNEYLRGANYKPTDLPHALLLLNEAKKYFRSIDIDVNKR